MRVEGDLINELEETRKTIYRIMIGIITASHRSLQIKSGVYDSRILTDILSPKDPQFWISETEGYKLLLIIPSLY